MPGALSAILGFFRRSPAAASPPAAATETDVAMMRRALELAQQAAEMDEVPVGAVVYRTESGEIVGEGFNRREADSDPAGHAELIAMRAAARRLGDWRLSGCTVVVTLEPCPMCAGMIVNARAGRLVFGAVDPKAGAVVSLYTLCDDARLNHRIGAIGGVLEEESAAMLRAFFRSKRGKR